MRILICNSKTWFSLDSKAYKENSVKIIHEKHQLEDECIAEFNPDFIFFVHWNWIVQKNIYERYECIVFHTAPLPYGRGGSPIQNLILNGFSSAPVSALRMTKEIDAGPIYSAINVSLSGTLTSIFSRIEGAINAQILSISESYSKPIEQLGETHVFQRLTEKDNEIPLGLNIEQFYDRVRMLDHEDYPNAFIFYGNSKIEFSNAVLDKNELTLSCKITISH